MCFVFGLFCDPEVLGWRSLLRSIMDAIRNTVYNKIDALNVFQADDGNVHVLVQYTAQTTGLPLIKSMWMLSKYD